MAYLDSASSEPLHPAARTALAAALADGWADPARLHSQGRRARLLLDQARETAAAALGCRADEISFTGSGTQAVHLAVLGAVLARRSAVRGAGHLVCSAIEHSSVLAAAAVAQASGSALTVAGAGPAGRADLEQFTAAVERDGTVLACLQTANQETGVLQPVAAAALACQRAGVPLLTDAAAAAGRIEIPAGWSLLAASAHKWGGPAGVGVLAVRKQVRWRSPSPADERESGRVPGFPDVPAIAAAAAALDACYAARDRADAALRPLTTLIRRRLPELVPDCVVHGDPVGTLPHIVTVSFLYVDGEALVTELDKAGFSVSSGSACAADSDQPSHVLAAMGALTHGNIRVSLPADVTADTVHRFLDAVPPMVARLRGALAPGGHDGVAAR